MSHLGNVASMIALAVLSAGCGAGTQVHHPHESGRSLAEVFTSAFEREMASSVAFTGYLEVLERASADLSAPNAFEAVVATTNLLSEGVLIEDEGRSPIAYRSREALEQSVARLSRAWSRAGEISQGPTFAVGLTRGLIARAMHRFALYAGDESAAESWGNRRACVEQVVAVGPLDAFPLAALSERLPFLSRAPFPHQFDVQSPFRRTMSPVTLRADACVFQTVGMGAAQGTRLLVADVVASQPELVNLALTSNSAAAVEIAGVTVLSRAFSAGDRPVTRLAAVELPKGRSRLVVRLAARNDGGTVELDLWDQNGLPIPALAPEPGQTAEATRPKIVVANELDGAFSGIDAKSTAETPVSVRTLHGAALLATGDSRRVRSLVENVGVAKAPETPMQLLLMRALFESDDLPESVAVSRIGGAIEAILKAEPHSWEARMARARLVERRRGQGEQAAHALQDIGIQVDAEKPGEVTFQETDPMLLAYAARLAKRASLTDVAHHALVELEARAKESPLLLRTDRLVEPRGTADALRIACNAVYERAESFCLDALLLSGSHVKAHQELSRLRKLRSSETAFLGRELELYLAEGKLGPALAVYDKMLPAERVLAEAPAFAAGLGNDAAAAFRLARDEESARDAPFGIAPIFRTLKSSPDPAHEFETQGRALVLDDLRTPYKQGAGTAVLLHSETYRLASSGLLRYVVYDLRRVTGTADVAQGAAIYAPLIDGKSAIKLLRRRIHKPDGRILEPDAASNAAQEQSDLSQLEQGDYIEQVADGWALPGDIGHLIVDSPDLLPERTSLREAQVSLTVPQGLKLVAWSHPLLGTGVETRLANEVTTRWRATDLAPRKLENGIPRMDRNVGISFGTMTWGDVARAVDEHLRSLDERDSYARRWLERKLGKGFLREAPVAKISSLFGGRADAQSQRPAEPNVAMGSEPSESQVQDAWLARLVSAVGKEVRVTPAIALTDVSALYSSGSQRTTARTMLELGQGSRVWVLHRLLREVGIGSEISIAEAEPFSASPNFPAHAGRFFHPLLQVTLPGASPRKIWLDADVEGPPMPPGQVSPELGGRGVLSLNGQVETLARLPAEARDAVVADLELDTRGDASGTVEIVLRSRAAQMLSDALETVVGTARLELLRSVVMAWMPHADVQEASVASKPGSYELILRASIRIHGYAYPEGASQDVLVLPGLLPVHFIYPGAFVSTLASTYASRETRENALSIESALNYKLTLKLKLPKGATTDRVPPELNVEEPAFRARRRTATAGGGVINDEFELSVPTSVVALKDYPAFVKLAHAIDSAFLAGARVRVAP